MITVNLGTSAEATAVTIFAPCLAMPSCSYFLPTMKPVMFWRKTSGILRRAAQLDEVRALDGALGEQDAVVGDDPHRIAHDPREAADQRRPVGRLELVEAAAVDDAGDDLAHVVGAARVVGDDAVELVGVVERAAPAASAPRAGRAGGAPGWRRCCGRSQAPRRRSQRSGRRRRRSRCAPPRRPGPRPSLPSPVAAFTSGGPPRKIVPVPSTITVSSLIAGT